MARKRKNTPESGGEVEAALLKRALGFTQEEVYSEDILDKESGEVRQLLKRKVVTKSVPPDVRAVLFWLKNRMPDRWRERAPEPEDDSCAYSFDDSDADL